MGARLPTSTITQNSRSGATAWLPAVSLVVLSVRLAGLSSLESRKHRSAGRTHAVNVCEDMGNCTPRRRYEHEEIRTSTWQPSCSSYGACQRIHVQYAAPRHRECCMTRAICRRSATTAAANANTCGRAARAAALSCTTSRPSVVAGGDGKKTLSSLSSNKTLGVTRR